MRQSPPKTILRSCFPVFRTVFLYSEREIRPDLSKLSPAQSNASHQRKCVRSAGTLSDCMRLLAGMYRVLILPAQSRPAAKSCQTRPRWGYRGVTEKTNPYQEPSGSSLRPCQPGLSGRSKDRSSRGVNHARWRVMYSILLFHLYRIRRFCLFYKIHHLPDNPQPICSF